MSLKRCVPVLVYVNGHNVAGKKAVSKVSLCFLLQFVDARLLSFPISVTLQKSSAQGDTLSLALPNVNSFPLM